MRQRVRAIISDGEKYLFIRRVVDEREYWVFPGGGVEDGDADLVSALRRECLEELGVEVEVGEFFMKSYFDLDGESQEQHIFHCRILRGDPGTGTGPEYQEGTGYRGSFEVVWVHKSELAGKEILPEEVMGMLVSNGLIS